MHCDGRDRACLGCRRRLDITALPLATPTTQQTACVGGIARHDEMASRTTSQAAPARYTRAGYLQRSGARRGCLSAALVAAQLHSCRLTHKPTRAQRCRPGRPAHAHAMQTRVQYHRTYEGHGWDTNLRALQQGYVRSPHIVTGVLEGCRRRTWSPPRTSSTHDLPSAQEACPGARRQGPRARRRSSSRRRMDERLLPRARMRRIWKR